MDVNIIINGVLCLIMTVLIILYLVYIYISEKKKIKYYKHTLLYDTDWDKYSTMLKKQNRILLYKKMQLFWYSNLVKFKKRLKK